MKWPDAVSLNDHWLFSLGDQQGAQYENYDDSSFTPVTLPHDWQIAARRDPHMEMGWSQGYYPRSQAGWYRRFIAMDAAWEGKAIYLLIDGCQRFYDVYLNGERIGGHRYGYVPCLINITGMLKNHNLLSVHVNNVDTHGDRWYSGAGLCRSIRLLVNAPVHIAPWGVCVRTEFRHNKAEAHVTVTMQNDVSHPTAARLSLTLTDSNGFIAAGDISKRTISCGETETIVILTVPDVQRWDVDTPALYNLTVTLETEYGRDTVNETVGFRSFSFNGDQGFMLNGRTLKLYGANLHHDGGVCFGAIMPRAFLRHRLERLKAMGVNAIRCSHNPHDEALYELCDQLGLVVIDELYDKWTETVFYFNNLHKQDWQEDLQRMIYRDRNHPCIVLWSMGNELEVQYSEYFFTHFPEMRNACLALDPTRPVTVVLVGFCGEKYGDHTPLETKLDAAKRYGDMVDVFCGNYMENYYTALRDSGMHKPILGTEVFSYFRHEDLTATGVEAVSPWKDVDERPYVAGGFVWAGVDYLGESTGYPCKGWTGCPIDSTGIWKLRAWHLYAQWSCKPVVYIGVYDGEHVSWDGANSMWGFPAMSSHWSFADEGRMMHVAVITNCEEVRLYLNDEPVRICKKQSTDRLMHFYIPYRKGTLRAEGYNNGCKVSEHTLVTTTAPAKLHLNAFLPRHNEDGYCVVEAWLLDEQEQPWTRTFPEVRFFLSGKAEALGVDNGDFNDEFDPHGDRCRFNNGHAVAYLRLIGKEANLKACCEGLEESIPIKNVNQPVRITEEYSGNTQ